MTPSYKKAVMYLLVLFILPLTALASQQVFNQIYLNPFYLLSTTANQNYTYTVSVTPPSNIYSVQSAIISFDVYLTPTVVFTLFVNDKECNNPTYTVSTTYSGSSQGRIYFDCSNVISKSGTYTVKISATKNTGSMVGWLGVTYTDAPKGDMNLMGTDYNVGERGTIFLQLQNEFGEPVSNGSCVLNVYYPNRYNATHPIWLNQTPMLYLDRGIYYYDFFVPDTAGVYIVTAQCSYIYASSWFYNPDYFPFITGLSPNETVNKGTGFNQPNQVNSFSDWLYDYVDSDANKVVETTFLWKNITNYVNISNLNQVSVYWMGESSKAITLNFYIWNWTGSKYMALPTVSVPITSTTGQEPTGFDVLYSTVIQAGNISNFIYNGQAQVKMNASSGTGFRLLTNWLNIKLDAPATSIVDVKGNSEIKVFSPYGTDTTVVTLGDKNFDTKYFDGSPFEYYEGTMWHNITVLSQSVQNGFDTEFSFTTPYKIDCTALIEFEKWNGTAWKDAMGDIQHMRYGGGTEDCSVTVDITVDIIGTYHYRVNYDNYQKWQVLWDYSYINDTYNLLSHPTCQYYFNLYGYTPTVPILYSTTVSTTPILNYCHRLEDDYYWANDYYTGSLSAVPEEYESYIIEMDYYYESFFRKTATVWEMYTKEYGVNATASQVAQSVWNFANRNLTYYNQSVSQTMQDCLKDGTCPNWWINLTLLNLSNTNTLFYNLIHSILNNQSQAYQELLLIHNNQTVWFSFLNTTITQMNNNIAQNFTVVEAQQQWVLNNLSYWFPYLSSALSTLPTLVWQYPTRNLTYVDWVTGSLYVWNSTQRQLTYYNQSIAQNIADCLNSGVCTGWWINGHFVNLSNQTAEMYGLVQVINGTQNYWFVNISTDLNLARAESLLYFQSLNETITAGFSNVLGNLSGMPQILAFLDSLNQSVDDLTINISYYFPLFDGLLVNISQNQQYYYPLFNALLYNILTNQTISFAEFHDSLVDIMQNQSYYYPMFAGNFSNLTANEMLIISLLYAMGGGSHGNATIADCQISNTAPVCNDIVRFSCNITSGSVISSVVYTIGGVNYAPTANGSIYYIDLNYSGSYQYPQTYTWTFVTVTDAHSDVTTYAPNLDLIYTCVNTEGQLYCYHNEEPFLKQKIPFTERDKIAWLCYLNRSEADCVSEVYQGTALLQTNPEPTYIEGEGMVSTYRVNPTVYPEHYFQAWFNKKNLIADMPFNFTVRCNDGYSTLVYSDIVTPTYKSLVGTAYAFVWAKQNMALLLFIFIAVLFLILIIRMAVGRR